MGRIAFPFQGASSDVLNRANIDPDVLYGSKKASASDIAKFEAAKTEHSGGNGRLAVWGAPGAPRAADSAKEAPAAIKALMAPQEAAQSAPKASVAEAKKNDPEEILKDFNESAREIVAPNKPASEPKNIEDFEIRSEEVQRNLDVFSERVSSYSDILQGINIGRAEGSESAADASQENRLRSARVDKLLNVTITPEGQRNNLASSKAGDHLSSNVNRILNSLGK